MIIFSTNNNTTKLIETEEHQSIRTNKLTNALFQCQPPRSTSRHQHSTGPLFPEIKWPIRFAVCVRICSQQQAENRHTILEDMKLSICGLVCVRIGAAIIQITYMLLYLLTPQQAHNPTTQHRQHDKMHMPPCPLPTRMSVGWDKPSCWRPLSLGCHLSLPILLTVESRSDANCHNSIGNPRPLEHLQLVLIIILKSLNVATRDLVAMYPASRGRRRRVADRHSNGMDAHNEDGCMYSFTINRAAAAATTTTSFISALLKLYISLLLD